MRRGSGEPNVKKRGGTKRFDTIPPWLTKPDSRWQARRRHDRPNRRKRSPGTDFFTACRCHPPVREPVQPAPHRPTRPPGRLLPDRPCPVDDNSMINDPGKQPVKIGTGPVRLSARLRRRHAASSTLIAGLRPRSTIARSITMCPSSMAAPRRARQVMST